jgi:hypothetical protein
MDYFLFFAILFHIFCGYTYCKIVTYQLHLALAGIELNVSTICLLSVCHQCITYWFVVCSNFTSGTNIVPNIVERLQSETMPTPFSYLFHICIGKSCTMGKTTSRPSDYSSFTSKMQYKAWSHEKLESMTICTALHKIKIVITSLTKAVIHMSNCFLCGVWSW